ncbi:FecR family protein [bacterium A37T11]|nr:FecR family protein [bacterium A37T11]
MDNKAFNDLFRKYEDSSLSEAERAVLENWYIWLAKESPEGPLSENELLGRLLSLSHKLPITRSHGMRVMLYGAIAASLAIVLAFALYLYRPIVSSKKADSEVRHDINHGSNKAVLTLADGTKVDLSPEKEGVLMKGDELTYEDGTPIMPAAEQQTADVWYTMTTPNGGQYQLTLPDGSKVWLNAGTTITYPSVFNGESRLVELQGEAYFSVKPGVNKNRKRIPFIVRSAKQEVSVLGTEFNVASYANERNCTTTLVDGSVKVKMRDPSTTDSPLDKGEGTLLKPGTSSILHNRQLRVENANLDAVMGWKNGDFVFVNEDINSIMRKVERWYDVQVMCKDNMWKGLTFSGQISRKKSLTEVLEVLQLSKNFRYEIKDKTLFISAPL